MKTRRNDKFQLKSPKPDEIGLRRGTITPTPIPRRNLDVAIFRILQSIFFTTSGVFGRLNGSLKAAFFSPT